MLSCGLSSAPGRWRHERFLWPAGEGRPEGVQGPETGQGRDPEPSGMETHVCVRS